MITFDLPKSPDLLAAIGEVAIRHGQLDYILRMTIKSISGIGLQPSLDATEGMMSQQLRGRIRKMARRKLGEASDEFLRLEAFLNRAQRATARRNELLHGLWAVNLEDGRAMFQGRDQQWSDLPDREELNRLAQDMFDLMNELNNARLHGFLKDALAAAPP